MSLGRTERFAAPMLYGSSGGHWRVSLFGRVEGGAPLYLRSIDDGAGTVRDIALDSGASSFCVKGGESIDLRMESSVSPGYGKWAIEGVTFRKCLDCSN